VDWQQKSYSISAGPHTLRWRYIDGGGDEGDNCGWVDFVQWTGPTPDQDPEDWQQITYKHDVHGQRVEKKVDGYSTRYVYDGPHVIAEYDGNNNLLRKYIYGPGMDQPICMIEVTDANATYYYHFDDLGSVVALSDSDGDTVQTYEYSVYGEVAVEDANHTNPYMFAGRRYDIEIGLYYNRARYYNPFMGRFLQTDSIGYDGGMNLYAYCINNPLNFIDPLGLLRDYIPGEPLTGIIRSSEGNWWGLVGEWSIEDICAWYWCEPEEVVSTVVDGYTIYVELDWGLKRDPPARDNSVEIVDLRGSDLPTAAMIAAAEELIARNPRPRSLPSRIWHATDGYRIIGGVGILATTGTYVLVASNPVGWAVGGGGILVGTALTVSDPWFWNFWDYVRGIAQRSPVPSYTDRLDEECDGYPSR
jgi:RHS repeat-associated protein